MLVPFIRTLILYAVIIAAVKLMGKRQIGELQPGELVITILISAVASVPLQDIEIPLSHGLIPILTLMASEVLISALTQRNIKLRRMLSGNPVLVIKDGKLLPDAIGKLRLSTDDILANLRLNGVFDLRQVSRAQIETNGQISILLNDQSRPLTPSDMGITVSPSGPFYTLIADGRTISDNLKSIGRNEIWLGKELSARNVASAKEVYLMSADKYGNIIFCKKEEDK